MQCCAKQHKAIQCHAIQCNVMPRHTTPHHTIPCYSMPCHTMQRLAMPCHFFNAMPYNAMQCNVMPRHTMQHYTMPPHTKPLHVGVSKESMIWRDRNLKFGPQIPIPPDHTFHCNVKLNKKINEIAQTANFTDFPLIFCGNGP